MIVHVYIPVVQSGVVDQESKEEEPHLQKRLSHYINLNTIVYTCIYMSYPYVHAVCKHIVMGRDHLLTGDQTPPSSHTHTHTHGHSYLSALVEHSLEGDRPAGEHSQ